VELFELKFDTPLNNAAESQNFLLHDAVGSQIWPLHDAAGSQADDICRNLPVPLYFAMWRCDSLQHFATGSQILPL
jgi:hypothetical protein